MDKDTIRFQLAKMILELGTIHAAACEAQRRIRMEGDYDGAKLVLEAYEDRLELAAHEWGDKLLAEFEEDG